MSTEQGSQLSRLRNRFAVLLALARPRISPPVFASLLEMQRNCDLRLLRAGGIAYEPSQAQSLERSLEHLLAKLESGEFMLSRLESAARQYRVIFESL